MENLSLPHPFLGKMGEISFARTASGWPPCSLVCLTLLLGDCLPASKSMEAESKQQADAMYRALWDQLYES